MITAISGTSTNDPDGRVAHQKAELVVGSERLRRELRNARRRKRRRVKVNPRWPTTAKVVGLLLCGVVFAALTFQDAVADNSSKNEPKVTLVFDHVLPNVPGMSIKGVLVEYPPGGSSPAHTHPRSAFIYATVLEGAIRSSVNGDPVRIYHAGDNFYEEPGAHHGVSANASKTEPARLLAVMVVDSNEKTLTIPDK